MSKQKPEKPSPELQSRFSKFLTTFEANAIIQTAQVKSAFPNAQEYRSLMFLIQELINTHRIKLLKKGGKLCYKLLPKTASKKLTGLSSAHQLVLQHITQTQGKGIWVRNLKKSTGINGTAINTILNELERRELIKSVTSIKNKKQRLYIGFNVVPDKEHTGGVWFGADGTFDSRFVEELSFWVLRIIRQNESLSVKELVSLIKKSKISRVSLTEEDMLLVINRLKYDGEIEEFIDPFSSEILPTRSKKVQEEIKKGYYKKWTPVNKLGEITNKLKDCVCLVCPVKRECVPGGKISPETCEYFDKKYGSENLKF
eukprot:snap_masked-scaffold_6-processed-gene-14.11-mRNA-1 protein AED:1.00 eAED:1.00 QI:0/-1/0/0/-1/1/1/0/313